MRLLFALAPLILAACGTLSGIGGATVLTGQWSGTYTRGQGVTGLTLTLYGKSDGSVEAEFRFYEAPQNQGVPSGIFSMAGTYSTNELILEADETDWIENPGGWITVDLVGTVSRGLDVYAGDVIGPGCTTFFVER